MRTVAFFSSIHRRLPSSLLAIAGIGLAFTNTAHADPVPRVTFTDSVRELPAAQKATFRAMTAEHLTDTVGFNIPLPLRNQAELEAR